MVEELMEVVSSRSGLPTLRIGDRWVHSPYDPEKEAVREVAELAARRPAIVILLGMGLGYAVIALRRLLPESRILVVEANPAIYRIAIESVELPRDEKTFYAVGPDSQAHFETITRAMDVVSASSFQYLRRLAEWNPAFYGEIVELVGKVASMQMESLKSTARFGRLWWENTVRNLAQLAGLSDVGILWERFRGQPAFIFAAGPSLDEAIPIFREYPGGIRLAVDTSYETLVKAGVRIDAVFAIDAQTETLEHFHEVTPEHLIAAPVVPPALLCAAPHALTVSLGGPLFDWLDYCLGFRIARVKSGGSVTTFAFDLARKIEADPIVLVGADFAYRNGKRYAGATRYERVETRRLDRFDSRESHFARRRPIIQNEMATEPNLVQYARWIEWEIRETEAEVYRASSFGLLYQVPVLTRERLIALASQRTSEFPWPRRQGADPRRVAGILQEEQRALASVLRAGPGALGGLSSFYDPIVRPVAVISKREQLQPESVERVMADLRHAEEVLEEVIENWNSLGRGGA